MRWRQPYEPYPLWDPPGWTSVGPETYRKVEIAGGAPLVATIPERWHAVRPRRWHDEDLVGDDRSPAQQWIDERASSASVPTGSWDRARDYRDPTELILDARAKEADIIFRRVMNLLRMAGVQAGLEPGVVSRFFETYRGFVALYRPQSERGPGAFENVWTGDVRTLESYRQVAAAWLHFARRAAGASHMSMRRST